LITNQTVGNSQEERYLQKLNWLKENLDHLIDIFYQEEVSKLLKDLEYYDVTGQIKKQLPKYIKPEMTRDEVFETFASFAHSIVEKEMSNVNFSKSALNRFIKKVSTNGTVFFEENLVLDLNKNKFQFFVPKEQKIWFHNNFILFESPFGNEPPLDSDTFLKLLEDKPYLPLKVTVLGLYSGIISEGEVKKYLKTELTTSLRWLFLLTSQNLDLNFLKSTFPISLRDYSPLKILAEFKNTIAGNFYPKDSFERIQEVFHFAEEEVYFVLDESDFLRFHFVS
jgi:hypothetical protein